MLDFFNANQALFSFIATLLTALATFALVWFTAVLAKETRLLAERTAQPFVICSLESSGADKLAFNQTIRNTGNAPAFDILIKIEPALPEPSGRGELPSSRKVSLLPPGRALELTAVLGRDIHEKSYNVLVSWADRPNGVARTSMSYSLTADDGFQAGWNAKGLHQIGNALDKLKDDVHAIARGTQRVKVDSFDQSDRDREEAEWERRREEWKNTQGTEAPDQ